jgi:phosphoribosylanthranilate isomerase
MTKIKICGITNLEDAQVAVEAGADLLGFIFYEPSPRYVAPERVRDIVAGIREYVSRVTCHVSRVTYQACPELNPEPDEGRSRRVSSARSQGLGVRSEEAGEGEEQLHNPTSHISYLTSKIQNPKPVLSAVEGSKIQNPQFVGVFVNSPLETVAHILDFCRLDAVQLHGEETPEFAKRFEGRAFKALRPQSQAEAEATIRRYLPCRPAAGLPYFLVDAYHAKLYGGTGRVTDWSMAANIARRYPMMLAGSLTPANVAEAIQAVRPWGVDVSSGVEAEKGGKDHQKVRAFIEAVRSNDP